MANGGISKYHRRPAFWAVLILAATLAPLAMVPPAARAAVAEPQFAPWVRTPGGPINSIGVADFTGDGRKDVVGNTGWTSDPAAAFKLFLFAQQADGSLREAARFDMLPHPSPHYVTTLAAGDIDGDGRADVAVATDDGIDVFLQRNGTLAPRIPTVLAGTRIVRLVDLDSDGHTDLVASGTTGLAWLRGAGDGTFGPSVAISSVLPDYRLPALPFEIGNFNRDTRPDIVAVRAESNLFMFRQTADGTFSETDSTFGAYDLAVGDVTGDGLDDVIGTVASNRPGAVVDVLRQRPDGTLAPPVVRPVSDVPEPLALGDVNGDGRQDVVTLHTGWNLSGVLLQDTDGTLTAERSYAIQNSPSWRGEQLAVDDVTGDGRPDIVYGDDGGIVVQRGLPPLPPVTTSSTSTSTSVRPATTTTVKPVPVPTDEAVSWQMNAAHSGAATGGTQRPPLAKRWTRDLGATVSYPLIAAGRVFALVPTGDSTQGSTLYAIDAATGRDAWGPLDLGTKAFFAYGDGQVFVLNADGVLRSFDAATGRQRWIVKMGWSKSPPVFSGGVVYFNAATDTSHYSVQAVSAADGRLLWENNGSRNWPYPLNAGDAGPSVADGMVFTSSVSGPNAAWNANTGDLVWGDEPRGFGGSDDRAPIVANGLVWFRRAPWYPTAADAATGADVVAFAADVAPAFDSTQGYFLDRGVLEARDPRSQESIWRFAGDGQLASAPIVVNGYVYEASASGQVWALDATTGAVAWSDNAGAPVLPSREGDVSDTYIGLAAGQGIIAVPASNLLVAYAGASAVPATTPTTSRVTAPGTPTAFAPSVSEMASGFRIDAAHQGNLVTGTVDGPPLRKRWTRDLGHSAAYSTLADGRMFVAAGPKLFALDPVTGADLWDPIVLGADDSLDPHVSYADGRLFASYGYGPLRAFDAATGRELWSKSPTECCAGYFASAAVPDRGLLYALTQNGSLLALSPVTGEQVWLGFADGGGPAPPTVAGGLVLVGNIGGKATAFDAATGAKVWQNGTGYIGGESVQTAVSAGELWVDRDLGRTPLVRDAATGRVLAASSGGLPAFAETRTYALEGTVLRARDRVTKFTLWTFPGDGQLATAPVVVNDRIYVASATGRLWVLDPITGRILWSDDVGSPIRSPNVYGLPYNVGTNIVVGQGLVAVPASNLIVAYESVPGLGGGYHSLPPARLLDTRSGNGAPAAKVGPGATVALQVTGRGGVPTAGVSAVALNVTVTGPTAESFLTSWPAGTTRPLASNLNFPAKRTVANMVVVKVGDGGKVNLFNNDGTIDIVVDVAGWYGMADAPEGARYSPLEPARILDTRVGVGAPAAKVGPGTSLSLQVTGRGGVPTTGVSAVVVNVTVTGPTADSFLTAWPAGQTRPLASNLNYLPNQTVPNTAIVKIGQDGKVNLFNNSGSTDVVVDVGGWYGSDGDPEGARYSPVTPNRIVDTRAGFGAPAVKLAAGSVLPLQILGRGGVPIAGVSAVVLNVTVTGPTADSFLTAWPAGQNRPLASNLNFLPGQTLPNLVVVKVGAGGKVDLFNNAGSTDVVVDVAGWFGV